MAVSIATLSRRPVHAVVHPTLVLEMLKYLREVIDAVGMIEPQWDEDGRALQ